MKQNALIFGGIALALIAAAVLVYFFVMQGTGKKLDEWTLTPQAVSSGDPMDIVMDFYNPWLDARKSTSTDPYTMGLAEEELLSPALRERIKNAQNRGADEIDPVLCQTTLPAKVNSRVVSEQPDFMRILVMAREKELTAQSTFVLKRQGEGWYIDDIVCAPGEFDIPREFTFEREGFLLKSVPPPLNAEYWHLVFEEDGTMGHFAPLFFNGESRCKPRSGDETVCDPGQFAEATKVLIKGQMLETGVEVKRLEFIE